MKKRSFRTGFILGAGLGTRLRPLTDHCPKPLLPLGGRPVITYAMDSLIRAGVDRLIVNTHHLPHLFEEYFERRSWRGVPVVFRYEPVLLDTGGGLKNIEDLLEDDERIFCFNGDVLWEGDLAPLARFHEEQKAVASLLLRTSGTPLNVEVASNGEICDMRRTFGKKGARSCLFTGIYAVETSFLQYLEKGKVESVVLAFLRRIEAEPGSIRGLTDDLGEWHDMGTVDEYERLRRSHGAP